MRKFYSFLFLAAISIVNFSNAGVAWVNPENVNDSRFDMKTGHYKPSIKTDTSLEFRSFRVPPPRATLRDRKGVVLANDEYFPRAAIWIEGGDARKASERFFKDLKVLGALIDREIEAGEIALEIFEERRGSPIVFNQQLSSIEIEKIERSQVPRIRVLETTKRNYPMGSSFSHSIGWSTALNFLSDTYLFHPIKGRSGIESLLENQLIGKMGTIDVMRDSSDYTLKMIFETQGDSAEELYLGLDSELQNKVYKAVEESLKKGVVLVADALSGEIPVMLSLPSFDPTKLSPFVKEDLQQAYLSDPSEPMANRIYRNYFGSNWESLQEDLRFPDDFLHYKLEASEDYAKLMNIKSFVPSKENVTPLFFLALLQRLTLSQPLTLKKADKENIDKERLNLYTWNYLDFTSRVQRTGTYNKGNLVISQVQNAYMYLGTTQDKRFNIVIINEDKKASEGSVLTMKKKIESIFN